MSIEVQDRVEQIRGRIEELIGPQRYKVWFKNSTQFTCTNSILKIGVPNLFIGGWIEDHFSDSISQAARDVMGKEAQVSFTIDPVLFRNMRKSQLNSQAAYIEKNAERSIQDAKGVSVVTGPTLPPRQLRGRLDEFVVGATNRLAHSLAVSIVETPTRDASPVFFHSACGLGKTHLLQGIANGLIQSKPNVRWVYASGEEFTNQFVFALRERKLDAFRHRFRDIDVLLLDDIQFLANKRATQEEFLHTFNTINAGGKRVVLAADAHPKMIGDLGEPLINRLMSGVVVRIERPDFETRREILRRRASRTNQVVPDPVIDYIAERIQSNVRELEGCLLRLLAFVALTQEPVSLDVARRALDDHLSHTTKMLTVNDIEQSAATFFGLTPADLHTSRKSRTVALARNVAMFLARKHTDLSFPEIGRMMGNKNHTTVLLAARRIGQLVQQDAAVDWQGAAGVQSRKITDIVRSLEEQLGR